MGIALFNQNKLADGAPLVRARAAVGEDTDRTRKATYN